MRGMEDDVMFDAMEESDDGVRSPLANDGEAESGQPETAQAVPSRVRTNFVETWIWADHQLGY